MKNRNQWICDSGRRERRSMLFLAPDAVSIIMLVVVFTLLAGCCHCVDRYSGYCLKHKGTGRYLQVLKDSSAKPSGFRVKSTKQCNTEGWDGTVFTLNPTISNQIPQEIRTRFANQEDWLILCYDKERFFDSYVFAIKASYLLPSEATTATCRLRINKYNGIHSINAPRSGPSVDDEYIIISGNTLVRSSPTPTNSKWDFERTTAIRAPVPTPIPITPVPRTPVPRTPSPPTTPSPIIPQTPTPMKVTSVPRTSAPTLRPGRPTPTLPLTHSVSVATSRSQISASLTESMSKSSCPSFVSRSISFSDTTTTTLSTTLSLVLTSSVSILPPVSKDSAGVILWTPEASTVVVVSQVSVVTAATTSGGGGALVDMQQMLLVARGMAKCSGNDAMKSTSESSAKALSPVQIIQKGDVNQSVSSFVGQVVLLGSLIIAHATIVVLLWLAIGKQLGDTCEKARFPSIPWICFRFLLAGLAQSSLAAADDAKSGHQWVWFLLFGTTCVLPIVCSWRLLRRLQATRGNEIVVQHFTRLGPLGKYPLGMRKWVFPSGWWQLDSAKLLKFQALFSPLRDDSFHWVVPFDGFRVLAAALVSSETVVPNCNAKYGLVCFVSVLTIGLCCYYRPYRVGVMNTVSVVQSSLLIGTVTATAVRWEHTISLLLLMTGVGFFGSIGTAVLAVMARRLWRNKELAANSQFGNADEMDNTQVLKVVATKTSTDYLRENPLSTSLLSGRAQP